MRHCILILATLVLSATSYAGNKPPTNDPPIEKASVVLEEKSYSTSGGSCRDKQIQTKFERSSVSFDPITTDEKIASLRSALYFYLWLKKHNIDQFRKITADYSGRPLKDVLQEILPGMNVKFDGVSKDETVGEMIATNVDLEVVCKYLDRASGVFFEYSPEGLIVKANP